jgi:hypothetical protein
MAYNHAWMTRTSDYHSPDDYTDADPFKIIYLDPNDIKYLQLPVGNAGFGQKIYIDKQGRFDKYKNIGRVYDGDWDSKKVLIEDHCDIYRLLYDRYKNNMEWSESEIFKKFAEEIRQGKTAWHGCTAIDDLNRRARQVDDLYKNITENGYLLNYLAENKDQAYLKYQLKKIDLVSRLNEVTLNIDRDGSFIHNNSGKHRKVIAKLLGIKKIPVRILSRHKKWQEIRNKVSMAKRFEKYCAKMESFFGHPDLDDILPRSWK